MVVGSQIKLRNKLSNGLSGIGLPGVSFNREVDSLTLWEHKLSTIGSKTTPIYPNSVLTVLEGPKRKGDSANSAKVELADGTQGYVFWCELRASCDHV